MNTPEPIRVSVERLINEMRNSCEWVLAVENTQWGKEPVLYTRTGKTSHSKFTAHNPDIFRGAYYESILERLFKTAEILKDDRLPNGDLTGHPCRYWNTSCGTVSV